MDPRDLFLAIVEDLERLAAAGDDYSMLRASALLRQLLLNDHPLVHVVNRKHRVKFTFPVCGRAYADAVLADGPVFYSALGGIHASGPFQPEQLKLQELLAVRVLKLGTVVLTIGDLIDISANVLGGVHTGNPESDKERALAAFSKAVGVAGSRTITAAQMQPIILVVLQGLALVVSAVRKECADLRT